jgi:predicted HicB family RNase H-like nuclease
MMNAERYAVIVRKVLIEDEELWRATVQELPDVAEFAETREQAIDLALDAIESLERAAAEEGRDFPEPIQEEDEEFSGRVTLRMPKYLHRAVARKALADEMSLNSYIVTTLSVDLAQRVKKIAAPTVANFEAKSGPTLADFYAIATSTAARYRLGMADLVEHAFVTSTNTSTYVVGGAQAALPQGVQILESQFVRPIYARGDFFASGAFMLNETRKVG